MENDSRIEEFKESIKNLKNDDSGSFCRLFCMAEYEDRYEHLLFVYDTDSENPVTIKEFENLFFEINGGKTIQCPVIKCELLDEKKIQKNSTIITLRTFKVAFESNIVKELANMKISGLKAVVSRQRGMFKMKYFLKMTSSQFIFEFGMLILISEEKSVLNIDAVWTVGTFGPGKLIRAFDKTEFAIEQKGNRIFALTLKDNSAIESIISIVLIDKFKKIWSFHNEKSNTYTEWVKNNEKGFED